MTLSTQQTLPNRWDVDSVGAVATMGSTGGVDAGDPINLIWQGRHYVYFPGPVNNRVVGGVNLALACNKLVVEYDFGPTGVQAQAAALGCPGGAATASSGVFLYITDIGALRGFALGPAVTSETGSSLTSMVGTRYVRVVGEAGVGCSVEVSSDGVAWTVHRSVAGPTLPAFSSSAPVAVGAVPYSLSTNPFRGSIHRMSIYQNGVLSTEFNPARQIDTKNFRDSGQTGWLDGFGGFWQVVRASPAVAKTAVVTRNVTSLDELTDFIQLPASDTPTFTPTSGKYTVLVCHRQTALTTFTRRIFSSESAANNGLAISVEATSPDARAFVGGASTFVSTNKPVGVYPPLDTMRVSGAVVNDGVAQTFEYGLGLGATSSITGVGTISHVAPRNGTVAGTGTNQYGGEIFGTIIVPNRALTLAQMNVLAEALLGGAEPVSVFPATAQIYTPAGLAATTQAIPDRNNFENVATMGSTIGVDSSDPILLPHTGKNYLFIPAASTNYAGATLTTPPKSGVLSWVSHTPSFVANPVGGPTTQLYPGNASRMHEDRSTLSMAITTTRDSDAAGSICTIPLAGTTSAPWVNCEVDWATERIRARLSNDPTYFVEDVVWGPFTDWVDLFGKGSPGGVRWQAGPMLWYGYGGTSAPSTGFRVWYYQDGVPFFVCDPTYRDLLTPNTFLAETGQTITVSAPATGLKASFVDQAKLILDETNDYIQLPAAASADFTATVGAFTALVCYRARSNPPSAVVLWDGRSALASGATLVLTPSGSVFAGLNNAVSPAVGTSTQMANGSIRVAALVQNNGTMAVYDANGLGTPVSTAAAGAITHNPPRIGSLAYAIFSVPGIEILSAVSVKQALTGPQIDAIAAKLLAGEYR